MLEAFVQSSMDVELLFGVWSTCCSCQVICNDRIGRKIRVKCNPDDTIADLKKLIAAQRPCCIRRLAHSYSVLRFMYVIFSWPGVVHAGKRSASKSGTTCTRKMRAVRCALFIALIASTSGWAPHRSRKDHITLEDYEIKDGMGKTPTPSKVCGRMWDSLSCSRCVCHCLYGNCLHLVHAVSVYISTLIHMRSIYIYTLYTNIYDVMYAFYTRWYYMYIIHIIE